MSVIDISLTPEEYSRVIRTIEDAQDEIASLAAELGDEVENPIVGELASLFDILDEGRVI